MRKNVRGFIWLRRVLREDFPDDIPVDIGEPPVDAAVTDTELLVLNAQQVQDRGVEVVSGGHVLNGFPRPFIAQTVSTAGLHSAAGEPGNECASVMVASHAALTERHA